jgi:N,N-dimethylformamidase
LLTACEQEPAVDKPMTDKPSADQADPVSLSENTMETTLPDADISPRTLVGYSSETSVRPGDTLYFMVSIVAGGSSYQADLVKIVNGDALSRYRNMFEVREVEAEFTGTYEGREQPLNLGSYVQVDNTAALDQLESFSVGAWMFPTFDPSSYEPPDLENIDPFSPPTLNIAASIEDQVIVSRYDKTSARGWSLYLDKEFHLVFAMASGSDDIVAARTGEPVNAWDWAYVMAVYDAKAGRLTVYLDERPYAPGDNVIARSLQASADGATAVQEGPLRIAAARGGAGAAASEREKPVDGFNGRIQDVRVFSVALKDDDLDAIASETLAPDLAGSVVADWDFGRGIDTLQVDDISGNDQHGTVVNLAERGVRGRFWNGSTIRWADDPDQYDAITFHADDLYDAEWETAFSYEIPEDLPSGIYAARLKHGDFVEYITFFVAAPKGRPRAGLAVWLSDYNYLAYSNITLVATARKNYPGHNFNNSDIQFFLENLEYGTGGVYNMHVDGLYFSYGSRLRPDLHVKPNGLIIYNFSQDTHITAFLEHEGIPYDVITDELVDKEGLALLEQYRAIISATHPEYPTSAMVDHVADFTANGGRFIYGGGNGWFWSTDGHPVLPGVMESRNFHDIADRYLTSGERGGLLIETGRSTGPVFGNEMAGMVFNGSSPYRKLEDADDPRAAWMFEGTSEGAVFGDYGLDRVHGGAAGFEIDKYNPANGVPRHALHLATSEPLRPKIEDVKIGVLPLTILYHPSSGDVHAQADLVYFETPNGGAMFSTGSINWFSSTLENNFDNDVATISRNVIRRFLEAAPLNPGTDAETDDTSRAPGNPEYDRMD